MVFYSGKMVCTMYFSGMLMKKTAFILSMLFPFVVNAAGLSTTTRSYSIVLGASRVVMTSGKEIYNLHVENKQSYPVLIESAVFDENSDTKSDMYIITPPLFRLDGGQKNSISIIKADDSFPEQVESMNWICVKSIPPSEGSAWIKDDELKKNGSINVNVLVKNCIKLINRPESLDPALTRPGRFDRRVPVELPDLQGREAILKVHARKIKVAEDVDFNKIARMASGASGAELANIVN